MTTKVASAADLEALVESVKRSPEELERLASNPEDVLADWGLTASLGAVEFLRTMGKARYEDASEAAHPYKDALGTRAGES